MWEGFCTCSVAKPCGTGPWKPVMKPAVPQLPHLQRKTWASGHGHGEVSGAVPGVSSTIPVGFAIAVWPGRAVIWMLEQLE